MVAKNAKNMQTTSIKKGGRPAKNNIEKKQQVVSTKLTRPYFYAIQKRAEEAGISMSEYVRQAVVYGQIVPRISRQDADTLRKLAGEANNINQIARQANASGFACVAVELPALKNQITEIINQLSYDWKNSKR
jgi:predicted DNA binding CopG/RHH family protein